MRVQLKFYLQNKNQKFVQKSAPKIGLTKIGCTKTIRTLLILYNMHLCRTCRGINIYINESERDFYNTQKRVDFIGDSTIRM